MFIGRCYNWKCDTCAKEVTKKNEGLPKGWVWIKELESVKHACEYCKDFVLPEKIGNPELK